MALEYDWQHPANFSALTLPTFTLEANKSLQSCFYCTTIQYLLFDKLILIVKLKFNLYYPFYILKLKIILILGERLIQFATEHLVTEVLIQPQLYTLQQCVKNMLGSFTKHRHVVHGGYTFAGSGKKIFNRMDMCFANFMVQVVQDLLNVTYVLQIEPFLTRHLNFLNKTCI